MQSTSDLIAQARQDAARGDLAGAARIFDALLSREPANPAVVIAVAAFEASQGAVEHAIARLTHATAACAASAPIYLFLGILQHNMGDRRAAITSLEAGLRLQPARPIEALGVLASYAIDDARFDEASVLLARLLELAPNDAQAINMLGSAQMSLGNLKAARRAFERAAELDPSVAHTSSNLANLSTYDETLTPAEVFAMHRRWAERHASAAVPLPPRPHRQPGRLRVGFLSTDFFSHSVAVFFIPLIEHLDRARIDVTCYASVNKPDAVTARIRGFAERWTDVRTMSDLQVAQQIWNDDIDLLIDLGGHTGSNRLGVFVHRPARVQATWLGYPNTTGLTQIDFRITDEIADPPLAGDPAQSWHSERLLRLDGPFFCYGGLGDGVEPIGPGSPEAALLPADAAGHVTFGVASRMSKVQPLAARLWARLMRTIPGSRLQIVASACTSKFTRDFLAELFEGEGITADRLDLIASKPFKDYLDLYKTWDLVLDTYPANSHTTSCHALWMGAPLVTLAGPTHASRLGASTLHYAGVSELIAHTPDEFIAISSELVNDRPRLRAMRASLHERMIHSPAMDAPAFARSFERAIGQMTATVEAVSG